ncbi:hypothetical protein E2C01_092049 [Portunus trituberculatus]|uniref:Uncharacterized protein n=1 Tax=Portunus trituberculatus TaxID=210409 RepID=A0A5B7JKK1_PORTR|nr:hypothetical protein [Portunus trituberculatus]
MLGDPYCPFLLHFLPHCPRFYSHCTALRSQLSALGVTTFDLPTLLAASGPPLSATCSPSRSWP